MTILRILSTLARRGLLATAALAAMSVARGAPAAHLLPDADGVPRVAVSYADLNLASPRDANRLLRRIADAAVQVCGDPDSAFDLLARGRMRRCISAAIARAVDTVGSEKLTLVYSQSRFAPRRIQSTSPRAASIAAMPGR
jgi:UrcA family protein